MLVILVFILCILAVLYYLFPFIQIVGDSMYPTYKEDEVLVGTRIFRLSKIKVGDVICYKSPEEEVNRIVIKRVTAIRFDRERSFFCEGDNSEVSYDSRDYGFVPSHNLVCRVRTRPKKQL